MHQDYEQQVNCLARKFMEKKIYKLNWCYFACEVLDGKIYSIGGLGSNSSDPHSWDIYDPCTNSWKFHADPNIVPEIEDSVVMDGKIYIRCGT
ncbi:hypothetical protein PRUPE_2G169300 [Prunus persica]|uniref:Uncharacterized protein n=1 Tax=Prunus persica TaxID=3760 RepID=M5X6K7_PRUPE|nr:hypothetical protein PRUPE_2G169300 [Prunus persica]